MNTQNNSKPDNNNFKEKIQALIPVFARASVGDFSKNLIIPKEDDELTEVYMGVQVMLEVIREKINQLGELNDTLEEKAKNKSKALEEAQKIAHIGSWEWDLTTNKIVWSDEMYRIYGFSRGKKQIDYHAISNANHPEDFEYVKDIIQDAIKMHKSCSFFHRIIHPKGAVKVLHGRASVITDKKGVSIKMIGTTQDVTELKMAEHALKKLNSKLEEKVAQRTKDLQKAIHRLNKEVEIRKKIGLVLKESESLYRTLLKTMNEGVLVVNSNNIIKFVNTRFCDLTGYPEKELIGKSVIDFLVSKEGKKRMRKQIRSRKQGKLGQYEIEIHTKSGPKLWMLVSETPIYDKEDKVIGSIGVHTDITERRRAEKATAQLAAIVETSEDAIISKNLKDEITSWNKGAEKLFGFNSHEAIGKKIALIIPKNRLKEEVAMMAKIKKGRHTENYETVRRRKDGSLVDISVTLSPVKNKKGNIIGVSKIAHDITRRKRGEEKFHLAVEASPNSMIMTNRSGKIIFINTKTEKLFGYKRFDILDKNIEILIPHLPLTKQHVLQKQISNKSKPIKIRRETAGVHKNGTKIPIEVVFNPIQSEEEIYILASVVDITERKKYETQLNSLARFTKESPYPVMRFSIEQKKFLYANDPGLHIVKFFQRKRNKDKWNHLMKSVFDSGRKVYKQELRINNRVYILSVVPVKNEGYVNLYTSDVTATKKAEAEIKRLSFIIGKTDNTVLIADSKGKIQWVNKGFERLSGYRLKDVKGTFGEILGSGKLTGLDPSSLFFKKLREQKKSVSYESKNYAKDGSEYWTFSTLTPILNNKRNIENIIVIESDITSRKKVEIELLTAKNLAENSAKAKELFLANMSHEIRTPMNAIMGIVQLLHDTNLSEEQKEYMHSLNFAGENLLSIINDVLDLSKIASGKMNLEKIDFDLGHLINDVVDSMSYRAKEKNIELITCLDKAIGGLFIGDPVRLNQVLINLISNAVKFTESGYVELSVSVQSQKEDTVNIKFNVKDTGIGIDKKIQEQIFGAFEQANNETTRKYGGTGLGLSIVKNLVNLMNGAIRLKSKPGAGSLFSIVLPFGISKKQNIEESAVLPSDTNIITFHNINALLVEDNILNQMVAERFLKSMGFNVSIAANGAEAVNMFRTENFDIVLMDIQMPEMNGYEATRIIRQDADHMKCNIPILAITAHAIRGEEEKCIQAGMNDYISKPLNREVLRKKLSKWLKGTPIKHKVLK